jgi:hypothetical protein
MHPESRVTQSRAKGRRAEREVAKLLAKWWGQLEPKCEFKPTPLSGGWGGRDGGAHVRAHFKASGDLMTTARKFPFTVEVKHREQWSMKNVVAGKPTPPWEWWKQACRQATEEKGEPLLLFKKNNMPWMAALRHGLFFERTQAINDMEIDVFVEVRALAHHGIVLDVHPAFVFADRMFKLSPEEFLR